MTRVIDFLPCHAPPRRVLLISGLTLLAVLIGLRLETFLNINSLFLGGTRGDSALYLWLVNSNLENLGNAGWFNTKAFYPYSLSLAWSDNFILPSLLYSAFQGLGLGQALSWNLLILSAEFLNGFFVFLLTYRLLGKQHLALLSGICFMGSAYFSANLGHPQLQFAFFLPMTMMACLSYLSSTSIRSALWCGFTVFLAFISTVYYAVFCAILCGSVILATLLIRPHYLERAELSRFACGFLLGLLPVVPLLLPYLKVREAFGPRNLYEAYYFAASSLSYISTSSLNWLYGFTERFSHDEGRLFSGLSLLALALCGFLTLRGTARLKQPFRIFFELLAIALVASSSLAPLPRYICALSLWALLFSSAFLTWKIGSLERALNVQIMTNRSLVSLFSFVAVIFLILSFGPCGNPEKGHLALAPYRFVYALLPGFDSIRASARYGVVVLFCLSVLAAYGANFIQKFYPKKGWLVWSFVVVFLLESYLPRYPLEPLEPTPGIISKVSERMLKDDVAIFLPLVPAVEDLKFSWTDYAFLNAKYMNWANHTLLRLVNGYSGQRTNLAERLPLKLRGFPSENSIAELGTIAGLRFIIFSSKDSPNFQTTTFFRAVNAESSKIALLDSDADGNFLFEYVAQREIGEGTYLLAPSYPSAGLTLELMSPYDTNQKGSSVTVYANEAPTSTISIKSSGTWEEFLVQLPESSDRVRPFKITFKIDGDQKIYLRKSSVK